MALLDFQNQYLEGQLSTIPRLENPTIRDLEHHVSATHTPVIFSGKTASWKAMKWTFQSLKKDYGQSSVAPLMNLPSAGIPYFWDDKDYSQRMTLSEFIDYILDNPDVQSYLAQVNAKMFSEMNKDYNFSDLIPYKGDKPSSTSVWIGTRGTHSGFHFDRRDNFLAQIIGRKSIILASPDEAANLYPLRDMFEKSAIDPIQPDFRDFPKLRNAHLLVGTVSPGDIIYIPQLWWHYLHSMDASMSVNHWYGEEVSLVRLLRIMSKGGIGHWYTALKDGFLYGLCKRPYRTRLRSDMPSGLLLYNFIVGGIKRRLL